MKYKYDFEFNGIVNYPDCADEYLELINDIAFDYDGCITEKELKNLINEMSNLVYKARQCIIEGKIKSDKEASVRSLERAEIDKEKNF